MKNYIGLLLISLTIFSIPVGSNTKPIETIKDKGQTVCPKCGEVCIYLLGERAGLNEKQVETILFRLNDFYKP